MFGMPTSVRDGTTHPIVAGSCVLTYDSTVFVGGLDALHTGLRLARSRNGQPLSMHKQITSDHDAKHGSPPLLRAGTALITRASRGVVIAAAMGLVTGCAMGPKMLRSTRTGYNQAIQQTTSEQLLLNLVRLKYRDQPFFLEVSSVSAQFQFDQSAGTTGTLNENVGVNPLNPDVLRIDGRIGYTERPTVTFTPLQGDLFATRMLEPIGLDAILLLIRSGWSADRVLRVTVQQMNGQDNASRASGPTPRQASPYRKFAKASLLWRNLAWLGALQIGYEPGYKTVSPPIAAKSVSASDLINAAREGLTFRPQDGSSDNYVVTAPSRSLVMRVNETARNDSQWKEFADLLGLDPQTSTFALQANGETATRNASAEHHLRRISIAPRSLMGVLSYLSHAIEVPPAHAEDNLITATHDGDGQPFDWSRVTGDLLRVHSQEKRPHHAAVAIPYRGSWFYIDDDDLESKSTFSLLGQLFALRAGEIQGSGPQLTLPVGG
jgi:hypothetical protein